MLLVSEPALGIDEKEALVAAIDSGWITMGDRVREFEQTFARMHGAETRLQSDHARPHFTSSCMRSASAPAMKSSFHLSRSLPRPMPCSTSEHGPCSSMSNPGQFP